MAHHCAFAKMFQHFSTNFMMTGEFFINVPVLLVLAVNLTGFRTAYGTHFNVFLKMNTWWRKEDPSITPRVTLEQRIRRNPNVTCLPSVIEWASLWDHHPLWHKTPASWFIQPGLTSGDFVKTRTFGQL